MSGAHRAGPAGPRSHEERKERFSTYFDFHRRCVKMRDRPSTARRRAASALNGSPISVVLAPSTCRQGQLICQWLMSIHLVVLQGMYYSGLMLCSYCCWFVGRLVRCFFQDWFLKISQDIFLRFPRLPIKIKVLQDVKMLHQDFKIKIFMKMRRYRRKDPSAPAALFIDYADDSSMSLYLN